MGKGGGPGRKISLNCLELNLLGFIYTLTFTIVKCDTPESISIPLTPKIIFFKYPIVPNLYFFIYVGGYVLDVWDYVKKVGDFFP